MLDVNWALILSGGLATGLVGILFAQKYQQSTVRGVSGLEVGVQFVIGLLNWLNGLVADLMTWLASPLTASPWIWTSVILLATIAFATLAISYGLLRDIKD